jgi:predicted RNA-binding Zn ribbon-like protein
METSSSGQTTGRDPAPGRLLLVQEFVNTLDVEPGVDDLIDGETLRAWLAERELIGPAEALADGDLERARTFREALRTLLEERDGDPPPALIEALNAIPSAATLRVRFDERGTPSLAPVAGGLDRALAELLAIIELSTCDGSWPRLKVCADDTCRWAFYDRSKNRSGSWCTMEVCGNRAKARSYRARQRAATRPPELS